MKIKSAGYLLFAVFMSLQDPAVCEQKHLSAIAGEYQGTIKRTEMTLWATQVSGPGNEKALALTFFPASQQQAQAERLRRLTDALRAAGQNRCDLENALEQVYRPGNGARAGLVLAQGDWELRPELKLSRYPEGYWMINDEYPFLRGREYMVTNIGLDPDTGVLTGLRLSRTGFIQNFFDNPRLRLDRTETSPTGPGLLAQYVQAKFAARNALNAFFENVPQESVLSCP